MFSGLKSLIDLQLGYVGVQQIPSDMWSELPSLQTLNLIGNDVRNLGPNAFKGLGNLRNLDLTANKLTTIRANTWMGLGTLRELSLRINKITIIEPNGFAHLPNINLILMGPESTDHHPSKRFQPRRLSAIRWPPLTSILGHQSESSALIPKDVLVEER